MKSKYTFILESEDFKLERKSTWTRAKQYKLLKLILSKYPTAKDFYLATKDNKELSNFCDPKYDRKQYIDFLKYYIIRYDNRAKIILSIILASVKIFAATKIMSWIGEKITPMETAGMTKQERIKHPIETIRDAKRVGEYTKYGHLAGLATGILTAPLSYHTLDKLDKEKEL